METWTAQQIADSNGAYSGRKVSFPFDGVTITGTLERSDRSVQSGRAILTVDGDTYWVPGTTTIEVDPNLLASTTAGKLADQPDAKYVGKVVQFADFHGRTITGKLEYASSPATAMYAILSVGGRERGVFRNTIVKVL